APERAPPGFLQRRAGALHLHRDRGATALAWFFGLMIVLAVAALFLGRFARTESVRGYVSAVTGLSRLDARAPGIVASIDVRQGQTVKRGQRLMQVQLRERTAGGVSTVAADRTSLTERRAVLEVQRERLTEFLARAEREWTEIDANTETVGAAFDGQEAILRQGLREQSATVARVQVYLDQGYATRDALNAQRRTLLDYGRQMAELKARRAEMRQQSAERVRTQRYGLAEKEGQLASVRNELSGIAAQIAGLAAQSHLDVIAPADGQVAGLFVEAGASVAADQVLAVVGDVGADPVVVLDVPARAVGLAKVGQRVVLKYDAFPFKTFGIGHGVVASISGTPQRAASENPAAQDPQGPGRQSTYRIEVVPESRTMRAYGVDEPIRLGSTLSADIVVERRRLIDWVLDPIRAMRGRG
ncbi:HlyD family efflux transporter periplasmic adaptor subunit, partial [Methylobacterium sp. WL122]